MVMKSYLVRTKGAKHWHSVMASSEEEAIIKNEIYKENRRIAQKQVRWIKC